MGGDRGGGFNNIMITVFSQIKAHHNNIFKHCSYCFCSVCIIVLAWCLDYLLTVCPMIAWSWIEYIHKSET